MSESERVSVSTSRGPACLIHVPGDGPALVLVHGSGGNARTWEPVLDAWTGFDLWCPALPGRDGSSGPPAETAAEAAAWLAELIAALELSRPIVLGHSFGGAVALELGFAKRVDVGALVLVSSGARLRVASVILDAAAKATADAPLPLGFAFGSDTDRGVVEAYGELAGQTPPDATLADWQACDGFDRLTALGELDARVLVVHGDRDQLTPVKYQRKLEQAIAGAERVEVAGAGHMLPWERPRELAEAVRAALG